MNMPNITRRHFVLCGATALVYSMSLTAFGQPAMTPPSAITAVNQVFGDGIRTIAIAIEYPSAISSSDLRATEFQVEGRTVIDAFASTSAAPADRAESGRFAIVLLSATDKNAALARQRNDGGGPGARAKSPGKGGPGNAGDIPTYDTVYDFSPLEIKTALGTSTTNGTARKTNAVKNLVVDDFIQREFKDTQTGKILRYNLFVPKGYDPKQSYPLVLFMHDAGATSDVTRTTLYQGLGAIAWASPQDQAERPCFVLAPQYADIIADDDSHTSSSMESTISLIGALEKEFSIDRKRRYATGQSGGCMMSIAMNIRYPHFFAATFLVAGQWDPALVAPLAGQKLWVTISRDDDKAYPGQNAIMAALEKRGARISRATWNGTWSAAQFREAFQRIDAEGSPINYIVFEKGTVFPIGETQGKGGGHRNTWRVAYTIAPIREWIFRQHLET